MSLDRQLFFIKIPHFSKTREFIFWLLGRDQPFHILIALTPCRSVDEAFKRVLLVNNLLGLDCRPPSITWPKSFSGLGQVVMIQPAHFATDVELLWSLPTLHLKPPYEKDSVWTLHWSYFHIFRFQKLRLILSTMSIIFEACSFILWFALSWTHGHQKER